MEDDKVIRGILVKARDAAWKEKWRETIEALEASLDLLTRPYLFKYPTDKTNKDNQTA